MREEPNGMRVCATCFSRAKKACKGSLSIEEGSDHDHGAELVDVDLATQLKGAALKHWVAACAAWMLPVVQVSTRNPPLPALKPRSDRSCCDTRRRWMAR